MSKLIAGALAALIVYGLVSTANSMGASLPVAMCVIVGGVVVGAVVG